MTTDQHNARSRQIDKLHETVLAVMKKHSRPVGNFDQDGETFRVFTFNNQMLRIELIIPKDLADTAQSTMEVRYDEQRVFRRIWTPHRSKTSLYFAGRWEHELASLEQSEEH